MRLLTSDADKSEIMTIRNMAATQQMMVDPQNRWMTYGQHGQHKQWKKECTERQ